MTISKGIFEFVEVINIFRFSCCYFCSTAAVDILQPVAHKFMFAPLRQVNELQQISLDSP